MAKSDALTTKRITDHPGAGLIGAAIAPAQVLAFAAFTFVLGFILAWQLFTSSSETPAQAATAKPGMDSAALLDRAGGASDAPLRLVQASTGAPADARGLPAAAAPVAHEPAGTDDHVLRLRAQADPVVLRQLIGKYDAETDPIERTSLRAILGTIDKPEALAFFARLAASSDVSRRQEAYEMLANAPDSPQVRNMLKQAMASEQTPAALVQAITALKPSAVEQGEADAVVSQLRGLSQHADASVRGHSILQLGQWDKTGAANDRYASALKDPASEVRQAAIFAIAQSGVRTESLKAGLLGLATSASESREVKGSAVQALDRFSLSKDEFAAVTQARAQTGS